MGEDVPNEPVAVSEEKPEVCERETPISPPDVTVELVDTEPFDSKEPAMPEISVLKGSTSTLNGSSFRKIKDANLLDVGIPVKDLDGSNPASPVTWRMDPDMNASAVTLCRVDQVVGPDEAGPGCAMMTIVSMVSYLMDLVCSYVVLFYLVSNCQKYLGGLGLVVALCGDLSMFFFGLMFRDQQVFFWPMNFKLIPFIPVYECVWIYRAHREWTRIDAATNVHVPRFLHSFGAMLCFLRMLMFTLPQMILTGVVRVEVQNQNLLTEDESGFPEMPPSTFYCALAIHIMFVCSTIAYFIQVSVMSKDREQLNIFGLPRLKIFKKENLSSVLGVIVCGVIGYSLACVVGAVLTSEADCGM